jgi:hypothetical protein
MDVVSRFLASQKEPCSVGLKCVVRERHTTAIMLLTFKGFTFPKYLE